LIFCLFGFWESSSVNWPPHSVRMSKGPCLPLFFNGESSEPGTPLHNDSIPSNPLRPSLDNIRHRHAGRYLRSAAVEAYRTGVLSEDQLTRLLGFESRFQVHALLKQYQVPLRYTRIDLEDDLSAHKKPVIVVADSAPLHYRILLDLADLLPKLYGEVLIPSAVVNESSDGTPIKVRAWLTVATD
jgi:hypothetical protein